MTRKNPKEIPIMMTISHSRGYHFNSLQRPIVCLTLLTIKVDGRWLCHNIFQLILYFYELFLSKTLFSTFLRGDFQVFYLQNGFLPFGGFLPDLVFISCLQKTWPQASSADLSFLNGSIHFSFILYRHLDPVVLSMGTFVFRPSD